MHLNLQMFNFVDPSGKTCDFVLVAYKFDGLPEVAKSKNII